MVNYLGILIATVAAFAVGALWFGPLFGTKWRQLMNIPGDASMKGMGSSMAGGFIATLVMIYVLAFSISSHGITTLSAALMLAFWIWLGFIATVMSNMVWYEKKSWTLYFINASHYLVALLVAAAVLIWIG